MCGWVAVVSVIVKLLIAQKLLIVPAARKENFRKISIAPI
jgi:hypothetical protein